MKQKVIVLSYAVYLLMTLVSCGGSELPSVETDTPKTAEELSDLREQIGETKPVTRSSGMNEAELLANLNGTDAFFEWFAPDAGFVAASIQINQRNTIKRDSDEIYATVTSINEYSSYTTEFYLCYQYYQEGGWRLETLYQSSDGMYSITYWPQEEDLNAVWDNKYAEIYNNGVVAACEVEETGNNYIMYLVTYYCDSGFSIEFAWAEVLFRFENGLWTTTSMSYPTNHVWKVKMDAVGTYRAIGINEDNMWVWLLNLHTDGTDDTKLRIDLYEYTINPKTYTVTYTTYVDKAVSFDLGSIHAGNTILYYNDGDWRNGAKQISTSNVTLTEADAHSMIQQLVEENGFPYWADWESAKQVQRKEELQDLEQTVDLTAYRQVCTAYYGQLGISFPADLDPCMYKFYLEQSDQLTADEYYRIMENAPNPLDYMDSSTYDWLTYIYYQL